MADEKLILSEIKKTIQGYYKGTVVDLDESFSHKFEFFVQRFEDILSGTNRSIPPNKWSYYRLGLVKKGSGSFTTGIYKFKAQKNTLVIIPSRIITSSKDWTLDTEGYIILFNMEFFLQKNFPYKYIENKKILSAGLQPYIHLTDKQAEEIEMLFETILEENKTDNSYKSELIALKVMELLLVSERLFDEALQFENNMPSIDIIRKFIDLLDIHFLNERSVKFYAEQLALHPNYLNALIKKHTGITAKESIQNRLLLEAKYLLHSTSLTVKEISSQVGFNDPNYFTSFFTRFENVSPKNYRAMFL